MVVLELFEPICFGQADEVQSARTQPTNPNLVVVSFCFRMLPLITSESLVVSLLSKVALVIYLLRIPNHGTMTKSYVELAAN